MSGALLLPLHGAADVSQLATRLATLRGEVEELAKQLSNESAANDDVVRSLARQRGELELDVKREETRVQKLSAATSKRRAEIQAEKEKGDRLVPLLKTSLDQVRAQVEASMPFRRGERLAALAKIKEQHDAGLLTAPRALSRLWSFVEDEVRLTRESGLYKQTVLVDGEERLAEVVRVGMVMMFYTTDDGLVGKSVQNADGSWGYQRIDGDDERRAVLELSSSFKKQVRVGFFQVPNALPALTRASGATK